MIRFFNGRTLKLKDGFDIMRFGLTATKSAMLVRKRKAAIRLLKEKLTLREAC